jgi:integrase
VVDGREVRSTLHTLRHSTVTMLRELGYDDNTISKLLRHASPAVTSAIYGRVTDRVGRDASDRLGEALSGGSA